jgi:hypothetical protein
MRTFTLGDFDFALPPELIAQHPAAERSASRLLDGCGPVPVDRVFRDLPQLLSPGDLLVFNDTKVVKARLYGEKPTGGKVELLIERVLTDTDPPHQVVAHVKVSKKPPVGTVLQMQGGFTATLLGRWPDEDGALFRYALSADPYALMEQHGHVPLPPYIQHADSADDVRRYQTVFARHPGAVAAPTAALHFDEARAGRTGRARRAAGQRDTACGCGHLPAGEDRTHRRAPHAQRALSRACGDTDGPCRLPGPWWPGGSSGHHHRAHAGVVGRAPWPDRGRHRHLHHAGLSVPGGGPV